MHRALLLPLLLTIVPIRSAHADEHDRQMENCGLEVFATEADASNLDNVLRTTFSETRAISFPEESAKTLLSDNMEAKLRKLGYEVIMAINPNPETAAALKSRGFLHGPVGITWRAHTETLHRRVFLNEADISADRRENQRYAKLRRAIRAVAETHTITTLRFDADEASEAFAEWYRIYYEHVVMRPYGLETLKSDFLQQMVDGGKGSETYITVVRDDVTGKIVGGSVSQRIDERTLKVARAAFPRVTHKGKGMPTGAAAFMAAVNLAHELGLAQISYGFDPNFVGESIALGLLHFKSNLTLRPFFPLHTGDDLVAPGWSSSDQRFIKIFDDTRFAGEYLTFVYPDSGPPSESGYYDLVPVYGPAVDQNAVALPLPASRPTEN